MPTDETKEKETVQEKLNSLSSENDRIWQANHFQQEATSLQFKILYALVFFNLGALIAVSFFLGKF